MNKPDMIGQIKILDKENIKNILLYLIISCLLSISLVLYINNWYALIFIPAFTIDINCLVKKVLFQRRGYLYSFNIVRISRIIYMVSYILWMHNIMIFMILLGFHILCHFLIPAIHKFILIRKKVVVNFEKII